MLHNFMASEEGGVKGAVWTIGLIVLIVIIVLFLFILGPDIVYVVIMRLLNFALNAFGI